MKKLLTLLLFILTVKSLVNNASADEMKLPEVLISKMQTWNAENGLEWCKDGILSALARSLGVKSEGDTTKLAFRSGQSLDSLFNELKPVAVKQVTETEYLESVKARIQSRGSSNDSDISTALAYARNDFLLLEHLLGDRPANLANVLLGGAFVTHVYPVLQAAAMNISSEYQLQGGDDAPEPDPTSMLDSVEKTLLLLTSKTYSTFLGLLIGPASGRRVEYGGLSMGAGTPKDGMISPMVNLLDSYCLTQEYALANDVLPEEPLCSIVNVVSTVLACGTGATGPPNCGRNVQTYLPQKDKKPICVVQQGEEKGQEIPLDGSRAIVLAFDDLRPLPDKIPTEQLDKEGVASFFLFRSTTIVMSYAQSTYFCGETKPSEDMMPGWEISHVISYMPDGSPMQALTKVPDYPIALIGKARNPNQQNECQRILSFRGTGSEFEWGVDLDTMFVPFIDDGVEAHRGFVKMINSIWPSIQTVFSEFLDDDYCIGRNEVYVTGHSLGGGIAIIAGMNLAQHYGDLLKIHGVTFAAPNVMNEAGVEWYKKRVNNRAMAFDMDPVASAPCGTQSPSGIPYAHGFPRCDGVHHSPFGFDKYHSNPGIVKFDMMKEVGGPDYFNLSPTIGGLDVKIEILRLKATIDINFAIPPPLQMGISHACAYACKTSMYCTDKPENGWMCRGCAFPSIKMKMCCKLGLGGINCGEC